jgi:molybdopterin/thiamine biosynthesis adenylyltransferase
MPESESLITQKYERAVSELEENLLNELAARKLSAAEINSAYKGKIFTDGWQLEYQSSKGETKLNLLISGDFPFVPPVIGLSDPPTPLTYPHVENDGILCLLPNSASISPFQPVEVVQSLLGEAFNLLEDCFTGRNIEDFRHEFLSYWNRALTDESLKFVSLLTLRPQSRIIKIWKGTKRYVFGENEASIQTWLENSFKKKNHTFESAAFLWLPQPLLPAEYPKTNNDLWELIKNQVEDGSAILEKLSSKSPNQISILLGSNSELGPCLAGVTIQKPKIQGSKFFRTKSSLDKGFTPGHAPASIIAARYLQSSNPVGRYGVERADAAWVHGRGEDNRQQDLFSKKVVILGCGSVGSFVAKLLATTGVGQLIFVDPENLSRANTGRHFLGAKYVGYPKAQYLAEEVKENYPHLVIDFRKESWESVVRKEPEIFASSDLIISAIGDWSAEGLLNEWQQTLDKAPPILYGWTEPFALAGHAVAVFKGKACLQCHMNQFGVSDLQVTNWHKLKTLKQEPACGVMYQPYGPVELNNTITLVSEFALDCLLGRIISSSERIWACRNSLLESSGGSWTEEWKKLAKGNLEGGFSITREWTKYNNCPVC